MGGKLPLKRFVVLVVDSLSHPCVVPPKYISSSLQFTPAESTILTVYTVSFVCRAFVSHSNIATVSPCCHKSPNKTHHGSPRWSADYKTVHSVGVVL